MKEGAPRLSAFVRELRSARIPVVNISGQFAGNAIPTVCGNDPLIGKLAAEHFAERRFANVAWFSSKWERVHRLRFTGFTKAWKAVAPGAETPQHFVWSEHAPKKADTGWPEFSRWLGDCLGAARKPLGVFAYSDYDASRVIAICRERGLDVPGEVAVLGVDNNTIVGREIARQRLVQAKLLLRNTDAPLAEIAANTGLCNAAYLANVFKGETGLTPGAWRKSAKDSDMPGV